MKSSLLTQPLHSHVKSTKKEKNNKNAEILKGFLIKNAEILKDAHLIYAKNLNTY